MEFRVLTERENEIIRRNLDKLERRFAYATLKCANCKYPLGESDVLAAIPGGDFSSVAIIAHVGKVCQLCYAMYRAVCQQPGLAAAQREMEREIRELRNPPDRGMAV